MTQHPPNDSNDEIGPPGVGALSDRELLALLIGRGAEALDTVGGLADLSRASLQSLLTRGVARDDALRLLAVFELGRRSRVARPLPQALHAPEDAYAYLAPLVEDAERERFIVVVLDVRNRPRHAELVAQGSVDHCVVDPRDVFAPAIREHGTAVLIAHNHPSGDPTPSPDDIELTQRLVHAGELIGMPILDHVIIATGPHVDESRRFVSLAEVGVMLSDRIIGRRKSRRVRRSKVERKVSVSESVPGAQGRTARPTERKRVRERSKAKTKRK